MNERTFRERTGSGEPAAARAEEVAREAADLAAGPRERLERLVGDHRRLLQENADLRAALASAPTIEQAKGIVMARYAVDPEQAFALLRQWSQTRNTKLRVLSLALVDAASEVEGRFLLGHIRRHELVLRDDEIAAAEEPWEQTR